MKILHLHLKSKYFNDIKNNKKPFEYRLKNAYWIQKLVNQNYDEVHFKKGYPKNSDLERIIKKPYCGYEIQTITHPQFGTSSVTVFAIFTDAEKCECGAKGNTKIYGKFWCDNCRIEVI